MDQGRSRSSEVIVDLRARAEALSEQGRFQDAVTELEVAYQLEPNAVADDYARASLALGATHEQAGDLNGATAAYEIAQRVARDAGLQTELDSIVRDLEERKAQPVQPVEERTAGPWWRRPTVLIPVAMLLILGAVTWGVVRTSDSGNETPGASVVAGLPDGTPASDGSSPTETVPDLRASPVKTATEVAGRTATAEALRLARPDATSLAKTATAGPSVQAAIVRPLTYSPDAVDRQGVTIAGGVQNFRLEVTFVNPSEGPWDYGVEFRDGYRLYVTSAGRWRLGQGEITLAEGRVREEAFRLGKGDKNTLQLVVFAGTAYFSVNQLIVSAVSLPSRTAGDVFVGVGYENGVPGATTVYDNFTIWVI